MSQSVIILKSSVSMNVLSSLLVIGLLFLKDNKCAQGADPACSTCNCTTGVTGTNCSDFLVIKVIGSISYNVNASDRDSFNETLFTSRLFVIFPRNVNASVSLFNHSQLAAVDFVVFTARNRTSFDITKYQEDLSVQLQDDETTKSAFPNAISVSVTSAKANVDECSSPALHSCDANQVCFNKDNGYGCSCPAGFSDINGTCTEIYCMLRDAPKWPSSATRSVYYADRNVAPTQSNGAKLPYKTYIVYTCPNRYNLVNSASGKAQVDVIECVGSTASPDGNKGWIGGEVRCDMSLEFKIAIIMASISSVIIILLAGAFIVSYTKKKSEKDSDVRDLGVNAVGMEDSF